VLYQLQLIWKSSSRTEFCKRLILKLAPTALGTVLACVAIDSLFYGRLTIVPWNFLNFNLVKDVSSQYGINSVHWYFTNALPTIFVGPLGIIPLIGGLIESKNNKPKVFKWALLWSLFVYSSLGHKEHRFILPLVPLCICYLTSFVTSISKDYLKKVFAVATLLIHLPLTVYLSCVHQSGTTNVVYHLAEKLGQNSKENEINNGAKILFLMPCHSTPFHSHFHLVNAELQFLECPPKLSQTLDSEQDEADSFYENPIKFLEDNFDKISPSHIVCFDSMSAILKKFLKLKHFEKCEDIFHSHLYEGRVGARVHVHCKF
jgi:phosphatidylinositol glycan class B